MKNPTATFVAGEVSEACIGFANTLDRYINFTSVEGALLSLDEKDVVQNVRWLGGVVAPRLDCRYG